MKGTHRGALAVAGAMALAAAPSCVDLFHSTDFETVCGVDAAACGAKDSGHRDAAPDVRDAGPTNFCLWSSAKARTEATHACAWLGACSAPFDQNAFGQCMIDAILAYDCSANPNQTIAPGPLHDLWDALWQAKSCVDVTSAVTPVGVGCSNNGYACGPSMAPSVNFECVGGVGFPESCLVEGRACDDGNGCGQQGATGKCLESKCSGSVLHDCEGKTDFGYDCSYFGAGDCVVSDAGPVCKPTFANGTAGPCDSTNDVTCKGDKASACPTGQSVSIDCSLLTGPSSCLAGTPKPVWNVAAQCQGTGTCAPGCSGDTLTGCAQGGKFTTACSSQGLGPCHEVGLAGGTKGYACGKPGAK